MIVVLSFAKFYLKACQFTGVLRGTLGRGNDGHIKLVKSQNAGL